MKNLIPKLVPIDIALDPEKEIAFSGVCIHRNSNIVIMINFNEETSEYDGFNVFRDEDIQAYRVWEEDEKIQIKNNNLNLVSSQINCEKIDSFYSALEESGKISFISFFMDKSDSDYYAGKLLSIDKEKVTFKLISPEKEWIDDREFLIKDIAYFCFATSYEKELKNNT